MRRRLFTIVSAMSLLLCAATVALWVRTLFVTETWFRGEVRADGSVAGYIVTCDYGRWHFQRNVVPPTEADEDDRRQIEERKRDHLFGIDHTAKPRRFSWSTARLALHFNSLQNSTMPPTSIVATTMDVPSWPAVIALATMPAVVVSRGLRQRRRRARAGRCANCGYDLRATPERCPECGMAAAKSATVSN